MSGARRAWIAVGAVGAAIVLVNVVLAFVRHYTAAPGGPASSSYATAPSGLAAYADLLAEDGHAVTQLRDAPARARLDPGSTVVILDPRAVGHADARALRRFLDAGGRLVAGGAEEPRWLDKVLRRPPAWSPEQIGTAVPRARVPETEGVSRVETADVGAWASHGQARPALGSSRRDLLVVAPVGRGRLALLADASPLQNRLLARADDAKLGLSLAGPPGRPVAFVESVHGYGRASGLGAIPTSWRFALGGLVLAALVLIWARGRRLGPAEALERPLPPPRREYVDALAALLERSRDPAAAVEPLQAELRRRLERQGAAGLTDEEVESALARPKRPEDVLAAGRALARLERGGA
jgi:Domain of unknown function (DUF4350)